MWKFKLCKYAVQIKFSYWHFPVQWDKHYKHCRECITLHFLLIWDYSVVTYLGHNLTHMAQLLILSWICFKKSLQNAWQIFEVLFWVIISKQQILSLQIEIREMVSFELGKEIEKEVFCLVTRFIYVWILAWHTHVTCHQLNNLYT